MGLKQYHGLLNGLLQVTGNILFEIGDDYTFLDVHFYNDSDLFIKPSEFLGKKIPDILPAEHWFYIKPYFEDARRTSRKQSFDYRSFLPNDKRWFRGLLIFTKDGDQGTSFLMNIQEITHEKAALRSIKYHRDFEDLLVHATSSFIQSNENNFDEVLNSVLERIGKFARVDRSYVFMINDEAQTMSNTHEWNSPDVSSEKENLQDVPISLVPQWMNSLVRNEEVYIREVQQLPDSWAMEKAVLEPQGIQSLLVIPIKAENKLFGFIGFDSVKKKVIWEKGQRQLLQILADNLGSVMMRNIQSRKLQEASKHAQKMAEEAVAANRYKSHFLANMSHEIRTPLNGVIGFSDLLMETDLSTLQREYLEQVIDSAKTLLEVINEILDFSKIEAGKFDLSIAQADIIDIIERTAGLVKFSAGKKKLDFILEFDPTIPRYYMMDGLRIQQILINLLSNAIKFTHEGKILFKIDVEHMDAINHQSILKFSVSDTGIGIAVDRQRDIFKAFSQADISISRKYGGTGLGLSITNNLLGLMGSKLELKSVEGSGSEFSFKIALPYIPGRSFDQEPISGIHNILLVHFSKEIAENISGWLKYKGIQTFIAKDWSRVQKLTSENHFDLVLIDCNDRISEDFVEISEWRSASKVKGENIPIGLVNLYEDPLLHDMPSELGIVFKMSKPVFPTELYHQLERLGNQNAESKKINKRISTQVISTQGKEIKVLIAEDNKVNMIYTKIMISKLYENSVILEANSGVDAVAIYEKEKPALILMDLHMPEMDGDEATMQIRRFEQDNQLPKSRIVALTANAINGIREKCLEMGFDDYVSKPVNKEILYKVLYELCS